MIVLGAMELYFTGVVCLVIGAGLAYLLFKFRERITNATTVTQRQNLMDAAQRDAEALRREARLAAQEEVLKLREQNEALLSARRKEIELEEKELCKHRTELTLLQGQLMRQKEEIEQRLRRCQELESQLTEKQKVLDELTVQKRQELEKITSLDFESARKEFLKMAEHDAAQEAGAIARRLIEEAKQQADEKARQIISLAIQRYAGSQVAESTTDSLVLPNDEIKGRIIGREGRNIRAFENATGVTVLVDDTPNTVVLSGFDPVRREIARESMKRLIQDGRIHPMRIEEVVQQVTREMDEAILRHGEEAVQRAGITGGVDPEILKLLGRLYYRRSFSQNILEHSIEVAHIAGLIAAELGMDVNLAKRAGLFHDIGKAVNHEVEGAHAIVGAEFIKQHGEPPIVVNAVAAHHGEAPLDGPLGALLAAADAISASRPGARSETMNVYLKRVEELERIGSSFPGVSRCFAIQAGRELRVLVQPEQINDAEAFTLAHRIARKIEAELSYPGQIRVVVMRETKCVEVAK